MILPAKESRFADKSLYSYPITNTNFVMLLRAYSRYRVADFNKGIKNVKWGHKNMKKI